jgi:hypothetical protein
MDEKDIKPSDVDQLEEQILAARKQRVDAKVESGQAVRAPITVVTADVDDADDALVSASADRIAELRISGERREIIFEPQQIFTGVPRPARDPKYSARLEKELAAQTVEQRQQQEAEAAAQVEAFHEGAKSHEPEPPPAPLPKAVAVVPPDDLEWHGVVVQITAPTAGSLGSVREGKYGVRDRVLYVLDDQGSHVATRPLGDGEDAKTVAKSLLRDHYRKRHNPFYDPIAYPAKSIF